MIIYPYTYLIGWSKLDKWYYGCRWAGHPNDLWKTYFTSSKVVEEYREKFGEPDIIEIRQIFDCSEKCREWESKVLKRIGAVKSSRWLNKMDGKTFDLESILRGARKSKNKGFIPWNKGVPMSEEQKIKVSLGRKGIVPQRSNEAAENCRQGAINSGQNAVLNKTGIHAFSKEELQKVSIKGKNAFLEKMKDPAYAEEHARKIREGHAKRRERKHEDQKKKDSFGFY